MIYEDSKSILFSALWTLISPPKIGSQPGRERERELEREREGEEADIKRERNAHT